MDDISQQLKNEIHSLESYIERTEDRLLATHWSAALLDPLEADAPGLSDDDLKAALLVLQRAKAKFDVNGRVGTRIDGVLEKFAPLLPAPLQEGIADEEADADLVVSADVSTDSDAFTEIADSLFEEEEEEEFEDPDELFDDREEAEEAMAETSPDPALFDFGDDESPLSSPAFTSLDLTEDDVEGSVDAIHPLPATPAAQPAAPAFEGFSEVEPAVGGSSDDLFASEVEAGALPQSSSSGAAGTAREGLPRSRSEGDEEGTREARSRPPEQRDTEVDIFSHKISLEDIQAALDLTLQGEDVVPLQQRLRAKLSDKVVAGLRASKVAEKQFILIPRIARFVHKGVSQPCTVLTLAKAFPAMFGQLQELARYRGSAFMTSETPEPGWALISQEAPP